MLYRLYMEHGIAKHVKIILYFLHVLNYISTRLKYMVNDI